MFYRIRDENGVAAKTMRDLRFGLADCLADSVLYTRRNASTFAGVCVLDRYIRPEGVTAVGVHLLFEQPQVLFSTGERYCTVQNRRPYLVIMTPDEKRELIAALREWLGIEYESPAEQADRIYRGRNAEAIAAESGCLPIEGLSPEADILVMGRNDMLDLTDDTRLWRGRLREFRASEARRNASLAGEDAKPDVDVSK